MYIYTHIYIHTHEQRYISNSKCPVDTKLDKVAVYDTGPTLSKSHHS